MTDDFNSNKPIAPTAVEDAPARAGKPSPPGWEMKHSYDEARRAYVGPKYHRFARSFERCDAVWGFKVTFSLGVLLMGGSWFLYRKMYEEFLVFFVGGILLGVFEGLFDLPPILTVVVLPIIICIMANGLYWEAVDKQIVKAIELYPNDPQAALDWLSTVGGVHKWVLVTFIVIIGLFVALSSAILYFYWYAIM